MINVDLQIVDGCAWQAVNLAIGLIQSVEAHADLTGGTASEITLAGEVPSGEKIIEFPLAEQKRLTGLEVPPTEMRVILRHALKNAAIPIITVVGLTFALLVSGAVVTERVFNIPGMGNLVVNAVLRRDYPVIQGTLIVVAMLYVLVNLAVDLLYLVVDKRVKY